MLDFFNDYFLFALLIFTFYFLIISIFGFFIHLVITKEKKERKFSLLIVLKSFTLGLCFHILYSIIVVSFQIFNFFTIYLPFIILDISLLIWYLKKNDISLKNKIRDIHKNRIVNFFKKYIIDILILIVIFFMQYTLQIFFIGRDLPFPYSDPYFWFKNIWVVHENGALNYEYIEANTPGYVLFCASMISITDNYYIIYYFCKYLPIFLSAINILVLFEISKKIFKKKINIFFTLSIYLSMNYLFYRYQMLVSSTLATTLGFLFLLFLLDSSISHKLLKDLKDRDGKFRRYKNLNILSRGIILGGIILVHPLYGLFFSLFYFLYEFYIFIGILKLHRRDLSSRFLFTTKFFKFLFSIFLIVILMLVPWYIGTSFHLDYPPYGPFIHYLSPLNLFQPFSNIFEIGNFFYNLAKEILAKSIYRDINNFYINDIMSIFNFPKIIDFYEKTIGTGITLIAISLLLPFNKFFNFNEKQKNIVRFIKFTFIMAVFMYFIPYFIDFSKVSFLSNLNKFLLTFIRRLLELFEGIWALLFVLTFNFIILYFIRLLLKIKYIRNIVAYKSKNTFFTAASLKNRIKKSQFTRKTLYPKLFRKIYHIKFIKRMVHKFKTIKKVSKKKFIKKIIGIPFIFVIIIISGFYYTINYKRIYYFNNFSDNHTKCIMFAGNYFNKNPLEEETVILVQQSERSILYDLIIFDNLQIRSYKFNFWLNFSEFKNYYEAQNISYVLFDASFTFSQYTTKNYFIRNMTLYFDILYRNQNSWMFLKSKA